MKYIYFDNAATTKLDDEVLKEMLPYLKDNYGNPSSIYKLGREARKAIEDSREKIAKVLNCKANEIYFTAGGSESDNTAIKGIAKANKKRGNHIITSKIEHPAVLETCKQLEKEGFDGVTLKIINSPIVKSNGYVKPNIKNGKYEVVINLNSFKNLSSDDAMFYMYETIAHEIEHIKTFEKTKEDGFCDYEHFV